MILQENNYFTTLTHNDKSHIYSQINEIPIKLSKKILKKLIQSD
jgi:hypothetical protein